MPSTNAIAVLSNCGSAAEARRIAKALVERRLAACANVISAPVESIYRWKGKVETAKEFLLIVKTSRARFKAVECAIRGLHSYDVPEIVALDIAAGAKDYLAWLSENSKA
jgi:periplasmic divalent cation tolerance protein